MSESIANGGSNGGSNAGPNEESNEIPSAISHISIGTNQFEKAIKFYDQVLATLGITRTFDAEDMFAVAYGRQFPEFWVQKPINQEPASTGNGFHVAFLAFDTASVDAFYEAAMKAGATDDGEPGARPQYSDAYYGCFFRDLDGHKVEAMFWDETKVAESWDESKPADTE
jgi:catechol 2,3-dioxygenase-like lactoylglutathione lyase family enzyme